MTKYKTFNESRATKEENTYNYKIEWDDCIRDYDYEQGRVIHKGPDSIFYERNYDEAFEGYIKLRQDPYFVGVKLI